MYKKLLQKFRVPRDAVRFAWARYGERTALISPSGTLTYDQLRDRVLQLVAAFEAQGLKKGDVCYMQLANGGDQIVANLASLESGIVPSGLPHLTDTEAMARAVELVPPAALLYSAENAEVATALQRLVPGIALLCSDRLPVPAPTTGLSATPLSPADTASIGFTSGTTGVPKVLAALHGAYMTSLRLVIDNVELRRQKTPDVVLIGIPVVGAGSGLVLPTLLSGGTILIPSSCDAGELLRLIPQHGVTRLFTTPSLLIDLLDHPGIDHADLGTLRSIIYGTELMPAAKLEGALRRFGPVLQQGYGSAEVLPPVSMLLPGDHVRNGIPAPRSVLSSAGRVVPQVQVLIADHEDHPLPQGAVGNILIKSPTQFEGYLHQPGLNAEVLRGGWLHIGDMGYFDGDGLLHVLGRKADLITRAGHVTYPRNVEEKLHDHPAVKEAAYVQVADRGLIAVSLRHAWRARLHDVALGHELMDFLSQRVPAADMPDGIRILEELPRSRLAKVLRREVRQALTKEMFEES